MSRNSGVRRFGLSVGIIAGLVMMGLPGLAEGATTELQLIMVGTVDPGYVEVRIWEYDGVDPCVDGVMPETADVGTDLVNYYTADDTGGGGFDGRLYSTGPFVVSVEDASNGVHYFPPVDGDSAMVGCFDFFDGQSISQYMDIGILLLDSGAQGVVVDDLNVPVEGAQVRAIRLQPLPVWNEGLGYLTPGSPEWVVQTLAHVGPWVETDALGEFEVPCSVPGWYVVEVEALGLMPFYLPDVLPLEDADLVELVAAGWVDVGPVDATVGQDWWPASSLSAGGWSDVVEDFSYQYEVTPDNDRELWRSFESFAQMNAVSQIDPAVLLGLSTSELLEAVLGYNFFSNYAAYNSPQEGMDAVIADFNGLEELLSRPDVGQVLLDFYSTVDLEHVLDSDHSGSLRFTFLELLIAQEQVLLNLGATGRVELVEAVAQQREAKLALGDQGFGLDEGLLITARVIQIDHPDLLTGVTGVNQAIESGWIGDEAVMGALQNLGAQYAHREALTNMPMLVVPWCGSWGTHVTVSTPKGSPADACIRHEIMTEQRAADLNRVWKTYYPNVVMFSEASGKYNCFSYAFHSPTTSNPYWLEGYTPYVDPLLPYLTDGSYTLIVTTLHGEPIPDVAGYPGVRAVDMRTTIPWHASYVVSAKEVRAKWGIGPLMQHAIGYDPFIADTTEYYQRS